MSALRPSPKPATRGQLRWNYTAVSIPVFTFRTPAERSVHVNTVAAWLWTDRKGVIADGPPASLHGARWVDPTTPIEVIAEHTGAAAVFIVREERIDVDEITYVEISL